jgi:glycosyltransferase involved in cell wall biosynthesis
VIAFLLGNLTDGGSETKTVRMANRLHAAGQSVHIIYLGPPHTLRPAIDEGIPVEFLDRRGKYSMRSYRRLKAYVLEHDIRVVFCINHYPLVYGWPVCRLGRQRRYCIGAMNTYEFNSLRDRFFMLIYAFILRRCDGIIFGSQAQERLWMEKYRLHRQSNVVIYNGVDVDHLQESLPPDPKLAESLDIEEGAVVIGCVAHLRPEKSHSDLLAAMKSLTRSSEKKINLLLVGEGPEEQRLRDYVGTNDLGDVVRFIGRVDDVRPYLALMDIFVMPSRSEVFSNAILEAMAVSLPVVCTAVGGSVEIVVDGQTGLTYPRHDVGKLVESLQQLVSDKARREQMGGSGAARVREKFSIRQMDAQYGEIMARFSTPTGHD